MSPVRIKICCIKNRDEAQLAVSCGANLLGLVARMPSGPGPISDEEIAHVARNVAPGVSSVLLTAETKADVIVAHQRRTGCAVLQLVDDVSAEDHQQIKAALPGIRVMQVIHVEGRDAIDRARAAAQHVDAILLDSGRPNAPVKTLGGTGQTHDWSVSREIVESLDRPVFLAGGLRADNVRRAIEEVRPFGIDLCSGVRTNDELDADKLVSFMEAVRA